ncbi:MAG: hypothetical protein KGI60_01645 [Patescibacteria group bacterium]|nr:hypothetical protein [Patescibacteria group bacterium]
MKLPVVLAVLCGVMAFGLPVFAKTVPPADAQLITVTAGDLGVSDVGLLPTNPFYFLKEWRRNMQRAFASGPLAKANVELGIVNEKAAEVAAVVASGTDDANGINQALRNYRDEQGMMQAALNDLPDQAGPDREAFLSSAAVAFMNHERLLDSIAGQFSDRKSAGDVVSGTQTMLELSIGEALAKDGADAFTAKLETALTAVKGGSLKNIYAAAVLARIHESAPSDAQQALAQAYNRFMQKGQADLQMLLNQADLQTLQDSLKQLPAQSAERAMVGEKIFEKQKESLTNPSLTLMPMMAKPAQAVPDCNGFKQQLSALWSSFAKGSVTNQEYAGRYADLKGRYDQCVAAAATSSTPSSGK